MSSALLFGFYATLAGVVAFGTLLAGGRAALLAAALIATFLPIDYLNRYFIDVPNLLRWLPFLAIVFLGLVSVTVRKIQLTVPASVLLAYIAAVAVSLISMWLNGSGAATLFVSQRGFIVVWSFVAISWLALGWLTKTDLLRIIVLVAMVSAGVALIQRVIFVLLQDRSADMVSGLMSVDGLYLYVQLIAIAIVLAYWLQGVQLTRLDNRWLMLVLFLSVAIGNNKAWVFFLPAVVCYMLISSRGISLLRKATTFVLAIFLLGVGMAAFNAAYEQSYAGTNEESFFSSITDPNYIRRYLFGGDLPQQKFAPSGQLLRGASVEFAYNLVSQEPTSLAIGLGPAATQNSQLPGAGGSIDRQFPGFFVGRVPLSMFLAETGLIGLAMQILILASLYFLRPSVLGDRPEHIAARKAFVVTTLLYFVYENVYFDPVFGLMFAIMIFPNHRSEGAINRLDAQH